MPSFTFTSEIGCQGLTNGEYRSSQEVTCFSAKWSVKIYPDGHNTEYQGSAGVFLNHIGFPIQVQYQFTLRGSGSKIIKSDLLTTKFSSNCYGRGKMLSRQEFLDNYMINNKTTVECTITTLNDSWLEHDLMVQGQTANIWSQYKEN